MQRLGKPKIPFSLETPGACEQDGQARHEEAGSARPPNIRVDIARGAKLDKVVLVLTSECAWQVLAALARRRNGNQRVARGLRQCRQCSQIARRIAFQP